MSGGTGAVRAMWRARSMLDWMNGALGTPMVGSGLTMWTWTSRMRRTLRMGMPSGASASMEGGVAGLARPSQLSDATAIAAADVEERKRRKGGERGVAAGSGTIYTDSNNTKV